jgi:serine protease Do
VNLAGEVVGINTAIIYMSQNIGFAISAETVIPVVPSLVTRGYVVRPFLGVSMQTVNPLIAAQYRLATEEGVLILKVVPNSPADEAGLKANDVVTHFAGEKITTVEEMRQAIVSHEIGEVVELTFMRGETSQTVKVKLGETPPP